MAAPTTARANANAKATASRSGFRAGCLHCGSEELSVSLRGLDLFHCAGCGSGFTRAEVDELLLAWGGLLAWLDGAPRLFP